jgi:hypothetical protein
VTKMVGTTYLCIETVRIPWVGDLRGSLGQVVNLHVSSRTGGSWTTDSQVWKACVQSSRSSLSEQATRLGVGAPPGLLPPPGPGLHAIS